MYIIARPKDSLEEETRQYPNRLVEIHKESCPNCPTDNNLKEGIIDPESADIKTLPKEVIAKEFLFVCAWRRNKLCKGLCDQYQIDEIFLKSVIK